VGDAGKSPARGEGAIPVRVAAAMSSIINWAADETNVRFIFFLAAQSVGIGALVVAMHRFRDQHLPRSTAYLRMSLPV
jgi:hypothetical protein